MSGSDFFNRTFKTQKEWPEETVEAQTFVQVAIIYRGREVTIYRNGHNYAQYTMTNPPQQFGPSAVVVFGRRHLDAKDGDRFFVGRIKDARIYDQALLGKPSQLCFPAEIPKI